MSGHSPRPLTVAVVGATGVVGRTMAQVLLERGLPGRRDPLPRLGPLGRQHPAVRLPPGRGGGGHAGGLRRDRPRALLRRRRHLARPGAPRGRPRLHRHRQLQRLADGARHPAGGEPGQPGRPRGPRGDHRQPELLHHAAGSAAHGTPGRRRPRARRSSTRTRPSPGRAARRSPSWRRRFAPTSPASRRRRGSTRIRSRSTPCPRSTSSWRTGTRRKSGRSSPSPGRSSTCLTSASPAPPFGSPSS